MSESLSVILALVAGILLGMFFYGGLWWTVQRGISSKQPALLFAGSVVTRTLVVLAGFYFIARGDWHRIVACLLGFFVARIFVTWFTSARTGKSPRIVQEGGL
jgi:F1F0 ATPase subunit 2